MTCFFLGWVAERRPELVREAASRGHEIASHGHLHQLIYTQSREQFGADLRKSKAVIEDISGTEVRGYRAPGFSIVHDTPWALDEVAAAGFGYDSSIFPATRGHGGLTGAHTKPHVLATEGGPLLEFPISVVPVMGRRICFFGGGYLRLFPYPLIRRMAQRVNRAGLPVIYYLHPREIDPGQPRLPMSRSRRFKTYVNLGTTAGKLDAILRTERLTTFRGWIEANRDSLPTEAESRP